MMQGMDDHDAVHRAHPARICELQGYAELRSGEPLNLISLLPIAYICVILITFNRDTSLKTSRLHNLESPQQALSPPLGPAR